MSLLQLFGSKKPDPPPETPKQDPGTFVDPFALSSIDHVAIVVRPSGVFFAPPGTYAQAEVWFKANDTLGIHKINARTLEDLVPMVRAFLEARR